MRIIIVGILSLFLLVNSLFAWEKVTPLLVAQSQIGLGEEYGNNRGTYIKRYMKGKENLSWCAGFISYCFKEADYNLTYTFWALDFIKYGMILSPREIKQGDLVVFKRKGGGHIGIIEKVERDYFISIEGNVGNYPAKVKRIKHNFGEDSIYRFIRIIK